MAIGFEKEKRTFTLQTTHSTYQMKVDDFGFLVHLYYGGRTAGNLDYLLTYYDRGFSGNPSEVKNDRTYSMDALPQEYPAMGMGDYRSSALIVHNVDGTDCCNLRYVSHEITKGKYGLEGLPSVYAKEEEADTLKILLEDGVSKVQVLLLYGVLEKADIITRSAKIINRGDHRIIVEKAGSACLDFVDGKYDVISR